MKIVGERSLDPPKELCFQAKGPLLDESLESLNKSTEGASQVINLLFGETLR